MPKTIEVDLALIPYDDELLKDLELYILTTAKQHDAHTLYRLPTVAGIGNILSLVRLDDIHDMRRFPCVQNVASSARLVKCSKASGGKRLGTSGKKIGKAHLKGAFSEAATLFLRNHPEGQKLRGRLENKPDQGKALSSLAPNWVEPFMRCSNVKRPLIGSFFFSPKGAERVNPTPNSTWKG